MLQTHLLHLFYKDDFQNHKIYSEKYGPGSKPDIYIEINGVKKNLSLKKGSGNSIHQEPLEPFIKHLEETIEFNIEITCLENNKNFYLKNLVVLDNNRTHNTYKINLNEWLKDSQEL